MDQRKSNRQAGQGRKALSPARPVFYREKGVPVSERFFHVLCFTESYTGTAIVWQRKGMAMERKGLKAAFILSMGFTILLNGTPQVFAQLSSNECTTTSECSSKCSEAARMLAGAVGAGVANNCESSCIADSAGLAVGKTGDAGAWMSQCISGAGSSAVAEENYYSNETTVAETGRINNRGIDRKGLAAAGTQGAAGEGRFSRSGTDGFSGARSSGGARRRG